MALRRRRRNPDDAGIAVLVIGAGVAFFGVVLYKLAAAIDAANVAQANANASAANPGGVPPFVPGA